MEETTESRKQATETKTKRVNYLPRPCHPLSIPGPPFFESTNLGNALQMPRNRQYPIRNPGYSFRHACPHIALFPDA